MLASIDLICHFISEMVKYSCNICDYKTLNKANYKKHLNTQKHKHIVSTSVKVNMKKGYNCTHCSDTFYRKDSLARYLRTCSKRS